MKSLLYGRVIREFLNIRGKTEFGSYYRDVRYIDDLLKFIKNKRDDKIQKSLR